LLLIGFLDLRRRGNGDCHLLRPLVSNLLGRATSPRASHPQTLIESFLNGESPRNQNPPSSVLRLVPLVKRLVGMLALASIAAAVAAADAGEASGNRYVAAAPAKAPTTTRTRAPKARPARACPIPTELRPAFVRAAKTTGLPLALLTSVAHVESQFHADARSAAGAVGVMQVLPETATLYGLDVSEPSENVLAGARYLDRLLDEMGSADLAIAAYNAGPTVTQATGYAPYAETVRYVADVNQEWRRLNGCV